VKKIFLIWFLFLFGNHLQAQVKLPVYTDSLFSTYYHQRHTLFQLLPQTKGDIVFIGNSITDGGEWSELFNDLQVKNRGISGDISAGVINRIEEVIKRKPAKVFLMISTNDLARGVSVDSVVKNILLLADYLYQQTPSAKLFIQGILPVNAVFGKFSGHTSRAEQIQSVNKRLAKESSAHHYRFIDLYSAFCNDEGKLDTRYSNDGLHLLGEGYLLWKHLVFPYVCDLHQKPSLIPMPQQLKWEKGFFPLFRCRTIIVKKKELDKESSLLNEMLHSIGLNTTIQEKITGDEIYVELRIAKVESPVHSNEAYKLEISENKILITANTPHGIFNSIQTLKQLMRDGTMVDACKITDWPAFSWRGFMVDVGRNYQSIKQLKQQIDVMASNKLNIFHFHLTEDIAWRLQSKLYPQLTDAKYMLRNPGEYYTLNEMKELIAYCKERYITLIPEIDMPGHSAAFTRAMGVDMQSEKGMEICKNILRELCNELEVPIVHIGGDEVKITNKDFLPGIIDLLNSLNKKVIAWNPGGNVPEGTILQMWQGSVVPKNKFPSVDSRHLYLNHFDPFDGVVATFNHQVGDVQIGNEHILGATLCNWPDRRVSKEENLINMNVVYPVMLSFAERCWQGGGWKNYLSDIGLPGSERYDAFVEFEERLLEHKALYFKNLSFPYVKQSDIAWKLIGPFDNKGRTETSFAPETKSFLDTVKIKNYPSVYGGTIWLRHFWHPMIQSHIKNPEDSSTWYALRNIWSDKEGVKNFWIGFNNLSRSPATDSPPANAWDNKSSAVWVNGKLVVPPQWKQAGQKGNSEIPLTDEGYEYREPTKIFLQKGWNTILIKAPVATFKAEWQNPVKWMFTFVQINQAMTK
jgi:lysophospholipase L1-like esterase